MRKFGFRVFFKYLCLATLTSTIFAMDPCIIQAQNYPLERALWNIFGALQYTPAVFSFLIPVIAFFYYHSDKFFCGKISEPIATLSAIAAFITMLGVSYYKTGGWDLVFSTENGQIIKAVILILSYWIFSIIFFCGLVTYLQSWYRLLHFQMITDDIPDISINTHILQFSVRFFPYILFFLLFHTHRFRQQTL